MVLVFVSMNLEERYELRIDNVVVVAIGNIGGNSQEPKEQASIEYLYVNIKM